MPRKTLLPILISLAIFISGPAAAFELYGELDGGASLMSPLQADELSAGNVLDTPLIPDLSPSYLVTGVAGLDFGLVRVEGEALLNQREFDNLPLTGLSQPSSGDIYTYGGMANAYLDIPTGTRFRPYVGGGIGYAEISPSDPTTAGQPLIDETQTSLAYQFKAGVSFGVTRFSEVTLGYRYFATGDLATIGTTDRAADGEGLSTHIAEIGLRINF